GDFHCPMGAAFYDDEGCIDCSLCSAATKEEMIAIDEREVLRHQGYKRISPLRGDIAEILKKEIGEGNKLIKPKAVYTQLGVSRIDKGTIELDNGSILHLGSFLEDFSNSSYVGIAICTISPALEERVAELFSLKQFAEAVMLDSVGSVAAEGLADLANYSICQTADKLNMRAGARFSPGYGKWNLSDQKVLFNLCDAERIGVSLNNQYMMIPRKSVSFCVGIGRELASHAGMNHCRRCHMKQCQYRQEGKNE
ncbi:vitamin B12 dependent-methionine synthase activation domain-containing protein, partial [Chloroflexota bacterium]